MLLTALVLTFLSAPPAQAPSTQITLNSEDRWALVTGLRQRLGGRFIIANLADGAAACRASHACVAVSEITDNASNIADLPTLLASTDIDGEPPVALVALRTGRVLAGRGRLYLTLSVYERDTDQWVTKDVRIAPQSISGIQPRQRLDRYLDSQTQL